MVKLSSNSEREILDYYLSRFACYLIVQNADPSKEVVAKGQTYFAIQTRKQEIIAKVDMNLSDNKNEFFLKYFIGWN